MTEEEKKRLSIVMEKSPRLGQMLMRVYEQLKRISDRYVDLYLHKFEGYHVKNIKAALNYFCVECDKKSIMMQFDNITIGLFYLLDSTTLARSLAKCFQFDRLRDRTPEDDTISLSLSYEACDAEDIEEVKVDRMINRETYEEYMEEENCAVYLCSIREADDVLGYYVEKQQRSLLDIEAEFTEHKSSIEKLQNSMRSFIADTRLSVAINSERTEERIADILNWLKRKFMDDNQIVILEEQPIPYTLRQLLVPARPLSQPSSLLTFMFGGAYRNTSDEGKRVFAIICQERKCNDPYLMAQCKTRESMMTNIGEYEHILSKKPPNHVIEVAFLKDADDNIVRMGILNRCEYAKLQEDIKILERGAQECKEIEHAERIKTHAMQVDLSARVKEFTHDKFQKMGERVEYDSNKFNVTNDMARHIAGRMDDITDRENGLAGAIELFDGFFEHSTTKTNHALKRIKKERFEQGIDLDENIIVARGTVELQAFDKKPKKLRAPYINEIMADNENMIQIERHREQNLSVNLMNVMLGKDALSRTVIPCILKNAFGANVSCVANITIINNNGNNNNINTINNNNNNSSVVVSESETTKKYRLALESLLETEESETKRAIIEEALDKTKKRKRVSTKNPIEVKRLILTKREYEKKMRKKNDASEDENEEDELPFVVIDRVRYLECPDMEKKWKGCDACDETVPLSTFYKRTNTTKNGGLIYHYLTNICNPCLIRDKSAKKKARLS